MAKQLEFTGAKLACGGGRVHPESKEYILRRWYVTLANGEKYQVDTHVRPESDGTMPRYWERYIVPRPDVYRSPGYRRVNASMNAQLNEWLIKQPEFEPDAKLLMGK